MKLIYCKDCGDIFNLQFRTKKCACGKVAGKYIDNYNAEITEGAVSIGFGNGSFESAIKQMKRNFIETNGMASRESYYKEGNGKIDYAWVRPNEGEGNPHCKVVEHIK